MPVIWLGSVLSLSPVDLSVIFTKVFEYYSVFSIMVFVPLGTLGGWS